MQNQEFDDILASLQQIVRQAYALGRSDALKQVVDVLKNDGTAARPLALMAPVETPTEPQSKLAAEVEKAKTPVPLTASNDDAGLQADSSAPWWAREPRRMW